MAKAARVVNQEVGGDIVVEIRKCAQDVRKGFTAISANEAEEWADRIAAATLALVDSDTHLITSSYMALSKVLDAIEDGELVAGNCPSNYVSKLVEQIRGVLDEIRAVSKLPEKKQKKSEKKTAVYLCKYWEFDNDDPAGCGESWSWCHNENSGRRECGCKRTYAMQFCPFYKKGELAGKWVVNEVDRAAAEAFMKEFQ